jgi:hypothetical protein
LADVRFPIIGIDFLLQFQLVVDVCAEQLLPRPALAQPLAGDVFAVAQQAVQPAAATTGWSEVLAAFPAVTQPITVASSPSHGVKHLIETTGRPTTALLRRLDPVRLAATKQEFQKMLAAGVIRRSSSNWSSPFHMVRKKCCSHYRIMNGTTVEGKYPLPNMGDLSSRLDGCIIFSKLDLQREYYQVPVAAANIHTTVITSFVVLPPIS